MFATHETLRRQLRIGTPPKLTIEQNLVDESQAAMATDADDIAALDLAMLRVQSQSMQFLLPLYTQIIIYIGVVQECTRVCKKGR